MILKHTTVDCALKFHSQIFHVNKCLKKDYIMSKTKLQSFASILTLLAIGNSNRNKYYVYIYKYRVENIDNPKLVLYFISYTYSMPKNVKSYWKFMLLNSWLLSVRMTSCFNRCTRINRDKQMFTTTALFEVDTFFDFRRHN